MGKMIKLSFVLNRDRISLSLSRIPIEICLFVSFDLYGHICFANECNQHIRCGGINSRMIQFYHGKAFLIFLPFRIHLSDKNHALACFVHRDFLRCFPTYLMLTCVVLEERLSELVQTRLCYHSISTSFDPENIYYLLSQGNYHRTTDLQFYQSGLNQENKSVDNVKITVNSKPIIKEVQLYSDTSPFFKGDFHLSFDGLESQKIKAHQICL